MTIDTHAGRAVSSAVRFWTLAAEIALAVALPLAMTIANKSAPLVMCLAALFALAAVHAAGRLSEVLTRLRGFLARAETMVGLAFIAIVLASFAWTVDTSRSLRSFVELAPVLVGGIVLVACLPMVADARRLGGLLAFGVLAALASAAFAWWSGMAIHRLVGGRAFSSDLKRGVTPLAILAFPAVALLLHRGAPGLLRWAMIGAAFLAGFFAHSGSAMLGALAGGFALLVALRASRLAVGLAGAALLVALALAPVIGPVTRTVLPDAVEDAIDRFHARHRMDIWESFGERALERPFLGHGFGAPDRVSGAPRPAGIAPDPADDRMIHNIHPHNAPLQVWVELGLAGAVLAGLAMLLVLRRIGRLAPAQAATRLGCVVSAIAVSLVGFGLWQPWWIATLSAAVALFAVARLAEIENKGRTA